MPSLYANFLKREEVAEGTIRFHFTKPPEFSFKPGQHIDISLVDPLETDAEGNSRTFSVVSAPSDPDIAVTTRMRDTAFKRMLKVIPEGHQVKIDGPFGSMTLHNNGSKPAVFIAGGIGITPFMSMACEAAEKRLPHRIFLFYSNRRKKDAPFLDELKDLESKNPNFKLIATLTDTALDSEWTGERGRVDAAMLKKYLGELLPAVYYVAGPPQMVEGTREMLNAAGIDDDNIRSEDFAGY